MIKFEHNNLLVAFIPIIIIYLWVWGLSFVFLKFLFFAYILYLIVEFIEDMEFMKQIRKTIPPLLVIFVVLFIWSLSKTFSSSIIIDNFIISVDVFFEFIISLGLLYIFINIIMHRSKADFVFDDVGYKHTELRYNRMQTIAILLTSVGAGALLISNSSLDSLLEFYSYTFSVGILTLAVGLHINNSIVCFRYQMLESYYKIIQLMKEKSIKLSEVESNGQIKYKLKKSPSLKMVKLFNSRAEVKEQLKEWLFFQGIQKKK